MTPFTDSQVGPPEYRSHSEQQQTVTSRTAAHSKMVASQLDDATSSPQGRTEQHLEQTAKRAHTVASLQHDGQLRSPNNIREEHGTDELTDALGVSRSLFGVPPARSQLDAFFRQEKQQVSMNQQMSLTRCSYPAEVSITTKLFLCGCELTETCSQSKSDFQEKWNFDVSKDQPLAGRWKYDRV